MLNLLILILVLLACYFKAKQYIETSPPEELRNRKITVLLFGIVLVMLVLTLTGRVHWIGVVFAAVFTLARHLIMMLLPMLLKKGMDASIVPNENREEMTKAKACEVLGLKEPFSRKDVIEAHRKLIQKLHPDQGGNDYLASQLNLAKEELLKHLD